MHGHKNVSVADGVPLRSGAMSATDTGPLAGFSKTTFGYGGIARDVFRAGSGPGVVVIHEIPGITPKVAAFARRVVDAGFTVAMPSLVGTPGRDMSVPYIARSL